jgi:hypothetical protein
MSATGSEIGSAADKAKRDSPKGNLWLNGDVLACACPDCGGPMSVRLWLMVADCPLCAASIELTAEQRRQAQRLLGRKLDAVVPAVAVTPVVAPPPKSQTVKPPSPPVAPPKKPTIPVAKLVKAGPSIPPPLPAPKLVLRSEPPPLPSVATLPEPTQATPNGRRERQLPRWALALLLLLMAGAAYALWSLFHRGDNTSAVAKAAAPANQTKALAPSTWKAKRESRPNAAPSNGSDLNAEKAADELTLPRDAIVGLPELPKVVTAAKTPGDNRMFEARDPRIRTDIVEQEGGSVYTEAAVAAGLRWLARHQSGDGRWSLDRFSHAGDCDGQCDGEGTKSDVAATALALLPLLGAGQTQKQGMYQDAIDRGLKWLLSRQREDGSWMDDRGRMYAHGLATIVLCEALAMSADESLRLAAQAAIDFIIAAQHEDGGWRYYPGEEGDTSVVGWQLMALQAGRIAYLEVPKATLRRAGRFLDSVRVGRRSGLFAYQPGRGPSPAMTAEGLLSEQYLGWKADNPALREGINRLLREELPSKDVPNVYYWYYGTQVMHHVGGEPWKKWNAAVREVLLAMQDREGHRAGSWAPHGGAIGDADTREGGRIYMTSLALCTLEVYYRYLPLYRGIDIQP